MLRLALGTSARLCVCEEIYAEYEKVLPRPKLAIRRETISATLAAIRAQGYWLGVREQATGASDPSDNIFLSCASAACADYLVTGNLKHFPTAWGPTKIVSPSAFLAGLPR